MLTDKLCPLCQTHCISVPYNDNSAFDFECTICGSFSITRIALRHLREHEELQDYKVMISCIIRENAIKGLPEIKILYSPNESSGYTIQQLIDAYPKSFSERSDRVLQNLARLTKFTGRGVRLNPTDYPVFFVDDLGIDSINFMIDYLLSENLIKMDAPVPGLPSSFILTSTGWKRIYQLQNETNKESKQGFIAMWFNPEMNNASAIIHKAIEDSGFQPKRIDNHESNQKICDEIIAEIRKSKFVVCDFTGQRGGVYFEAGFAMGLGIPVIWMCRKDYFDNLHFDTRQYSHIEWEREDEIYSKLLKRIQATIV
jgi:nucleoside 2-deoxyribosyltransferase